jgi:hypothetical protein
METKPHYQKTTHRKRYIYSKANWNKVKEDIQSLEKELWMGYTNKETSHNIWQTFKRKLFSSLDEKPSSRYTFFYVLSFGSEVLFPYL